MERVKIALDAMGGDNAPQIVLAGASIARQRHNGLKFVFFGDEAQIAPLMRKYRGLDKISEIRHTEASVKADDKPSQVLRSGRDTSMWLAIEAVKKGEAGGVVSAGNTGALMAMAVVGLGRIKGIARPAIGTFFPTAVGQTVMLDMGANLNCDTRNLVQFAIMGEVFARQVLGTLKPTVGLLNIGSEEVKGNDALKDAAEWLRESALAECFHGFVEGDDIAAGTVDVVVTDGFTGNVALKTAEGTAKLIRGFVREAFMSSLLAKIGYVLAKRSLDKLRVRTDPRRYNGASLLGLNGVCVKSHGGTDALGFATAVGVAVDMVRQGVNESIAQGVEQVMNRQAAASSGEDGSTEQTPVAT